MTKGRPHDTGTGSKVPMVTEWGSPASSPLKWAPEPWMLACGLSSHPRRTLRCQAGAQHCGRGSWFTPSIQWAKHSGKPARAEVRSASCGTHTYDLGTQEGGRGRSTGLFTATVKPYFHQKEPRSPVRLKNEAGHPDLVLRGRGPGSPALEAVNTRGVKGHSRRQQKPFAPPLWGHSG